MWATRHSIVDWVQSKTQTLLATLETRNQPHGEGGGREEGVLCTFLKSNICSRQLDVQKAQFSLAQFYSLDAGLRMDGLPVLDLWDILIEILRSTNNTVQPNHNGIKGTCARPNSKTKTQLTKEDKKVDQLSDVDYVPTNTHSSQGESQLYILEDNEAAINVIFKGRSPTMRQVSRTHKVALDWLFDRIESKHKIQIKYVDTKDQLADIPTKGSFTRDEWNHLLRLLNIMNFSIVSCSHFFLLNRKQSAMSKRGQEGIFRRIFGDGEVERPLNLVMAKPRPMNLVSHNLLSTRKNSLEELNDSNNPANSKAEQGGVSTSVWKQIQDTRQNPAEHSQARQQEDTQNADT